MRITLFFLVGILLVGCAEISPEQRRETSEKLAYDAGWRREVLDGGMFALAVFTPPALQQADTLTVYIEGDGFAWVDSRTPSFDPTPRDPVALRLAMLHPGGHAVYLARPCQYVTDEARRNCGNKYWTSHRFAPETIDAANRGIDQLKRRYRAGRIVLVGYSGGGAVAALAAAQREDVARLVTVAGNLDIAAWAARKRISPLSGSLNPADAWQRLAGIRQTHFVGGKDRVVEPEVAASYRARFPAAQQPEVVVVPGFDHRCCWARDWPVLLPKERH